MKKSEKIGIAIVAILAVILVGTLLAEYKNNRTTRKDACGALCQPYNQKTWFLMTEPGGDGSGNSFPTKEECVDSCLSKKF